MCTLFCLFIGSLYLSFALPVVNLEINSWSSSAPFSSAFKTFLTISCFVKLPSLILTMACFGSKISGTQSEILRPTFFTTSKSFSFWSTPLQYHVFFCFYWVWHLHAHREIYPDPWLIGTLILSDSRQTSFFRKAIYCCFYNLVYWYLTVNTTWKWSCKSFEKEKWIQFPIWICLCDGLKSFVTTNCNCHFDKEHLLK